MHQLLLLLLLLLATAHAAVDLSLYAPTPAGHILKRCIHHVPSGSHLARDPTGEHAFLVQHPSSAAPIARLPRCNSTASEPMMLPRVASSGPFPADYDGWTAYTQWKYNASLSAFLGNFSVPDKPAQAPQVLYAFTGLQSDDWVPIVDPFPTDDFDIIQPVLQYPGDYGDYWSVKSWYVTVDAGAVASTEVPLAVGDAVFGNMTQTGAERWFVGSTSVLTGKSTTISVDHPRLRTQPWAFTVIECYGCDGCGTYPTQPLHFTDMVLLDASANKVTPSWAINPKPSKHMQCHEKPVVKAPGTIDMQFT